MNTDKADREQLEFFLEHGGKAAMAFIICFAGEGTDEQGKAASFDRHFLGQDACDLLPKKHPTDPDKDFGDELSDWARHIRKTDDDTWRSDLPQVRKDIVQTTLELGFIELAALGAEMERWLCSQIKNSKK